MNHNKERPSWDAWFMSLAFVVSMRSPDISTKHGAVLCNRRQQIVGVGYNGFPRGSDDESMPQTRPLKYDRILHAEENCLLNSQNLLLGDHYTMYVTGMPCPRCMNQMVQVGVSHICYGSVTSSCVDAEKIRVVSEIASEHGVGMRWFAGPFCFKNLLARHTFFDGINQNPFELKTTG